jgi:hypothetical protein
LALRLEVRKNRPTLWVIIADLVWTTGWLPFDLLAINEWGHSRIVKSVPDEYQASALLRRAQEELDGLGDDLFAQLWGLPADFLTPNYQAPRPGLWKRFTTSVANDQ